MKYSLLLLLFLAFSALANDSLSQIELTDGSTITAQVISIQADVYTVRSQTLGTIQLDASQIRSIQLQPTPTHNALSDIQALQGLIMSDHDLMQKVLDLQDDPQVQRILQNSEITQAAQAGDLNTLMANPEFKKLLENQSIQAIQKEILK